MAAGHLGALLSTPDNCEPYAKKAVVNWPFGKPGSTWSEDYAQEKAPRTQALLQKSATATALEKSATATSTGAAAAAVRATSRGASPARLTQEAKDLAKKAAMLRGLAQREREQEKHLRELSKTEHRLIAEKEARVRALSKAANAQGSKGSKAVRFVYDVKKDKALQSGRKGVKLPGGPSPFVFQKARGPHADDDVSRVQAQSVKRARLLAKTRKNPLLAMVKKQKLQTIVRKPNGDLDFPGEHFPPAVVELDTNSSNTTNATNSSCSSWNWFCEDEDDYDQDRTQDSIWDQLLRVPFTEHVFRTIAYHTQDVMKPVKPLALQHAVEKPHKLHVFDDDKDIIDSAVVDPEPENPPPLSDRDPDYDVGDFFDETRNATDDTEEGFQGGFDDTATEIPPAVPGAVSEVGERNFKGFADDVNVDATANATAVHPRAHMGDEFDAGGEMSDVLRRPETLQDPFDKDRFVKVLPTVIESAKPQKEGIPLEFGDKDVSMEQAQLPEDAAAMRDVGLETAESKVTDPRKTEFDYKFGLMSSFQDRNVDVKPVLDGAASLAAEWAKEEDKIADAIAVEGQEMLTEPLVEEDDAAAGEGGAAEEEEEEAAERR